jgi:tetrahydromethanopterin S-methyltransferase subunit G
VSNDKHPAVTALVKELRALKDRKDELEQQLSEVNKRARQIQERELPKLMENAELEKFTVTGAGTCYVKQELYVSMTNDEEAAEPPFYDWAREHAPNLIVPYIHPARLKSWAKERLEGGLPIPGNTLKATFVPTATLLRR